MKILRLLQADEALKTDISLGSNLGDAYLLKNNRIYRNLRLQSLSAGFRFSSEPNASYLALPLSQLESLMFDQVIPIHDNVSVLKQLERRCPNSIEWQEISENLKKNYLMHESCHAVARSLAKAEGLEKNTLSLLMEEAFANACELFGTLDAEDQVHRIFYDHNSYTAIFDMRSNLKKSCCEVGEETAFKFFVVGYLHANYLFSGFSDKEFQAVVSFFELPEGKAFTASQLKSLRALVKVCFTLDLNFRVTTTGLHMRLNNCRAQAGELENFSYFTKLCSAPEYVRFLNRLAASVLK